jgi:hypothetical protein
MNSLGTYIEQRANMGLWSLVSLFMIALSLKDFSISSAELYSFPFVLFFLLTMRLFDDLAIAEIDEGKENRSYTTVTTKKELEKILILAQLILFVSLAFFDLKRALLLLLFFAANHILYIYLFAKAKFRYFLPLLKYPFVVYILTFDFSFWTLTIYIAFMVFEMLEDQLFPGYLLARYNITIFNKKYIPYLFLLFFLLTHLVKIYYNA